MTTIALDVISRGGGKTFCPYDKINILLKLTARKYSENTGLQLHLWKHTPKTVVNKITTATVGKVFCFSKIDVSSFLLLKNRYLQIDRNI